LERSYIFLVLTWQAFPNLLFRNIPMGIQTVLGDDRVSYPRQDAHFMPHQQMFAPVSQSFQWMGHFNGATLMPVLPMHGDFIDNDTETLIGIHDDPTLLTDVVMGAGVSISDYGTDLRMTGRLVGHFETVEHGRHTSTSFRLDDLVYIEDGFGAKHMGYLLGSVVANYELRQDFCSNGMPRLHPGCPHHGLDCVLGRYMASAEEDAVMPIDS
jgi:hypothetical protein